MKNDNPSIIIGHCILIDVHSLICCINPTQDTSTCPEYVKPIKASWVHVNYCEAVLQRFQINILYICRFSKFQLL